MKTLSLAFTLTIAVLAGGAAFAADPRARGGTSAGKPGAPDSAAPVAIRDQAAAGNLTSFLVTPQSETPCRIARARVLQPLPGGCRIPAGQEHACRAGAGLIAETDSKKYCLPVAKSAR